VGENQKELESFGLQRAGIHPAGTAANPVPTSWPRIEELV